jgi:hypothetical protein
MSRLSDFMTRATDVQAHGVPSEDLLDDEKMIDAGRQGRELFQIRAHRAGIDDIQELTAECREMVAESCRITLARMALNKAPLPEIHLLASSTAMQFFLLGVLWEQERNMPDLDTVDA